MIVVCGIIKKPSGILICQRNKRPYKDHWEFPGGKLEKGETVRQCLVRELREELDIVVSIDRFFVARKYNYSGLNIHLFCYICSYLRGAIRITEHKSFAVLQYNQLIRLQWLPGNKKIIKKLNSLKLIN